MKIAIDAGHGKDGDPRECGELSLEEVAQAGFPRPVKAMMRESETPRNAGGMLFGGDLGSEAFGARFWE